MIKAVIFDMDGVIADTEPLHEKTSDIILNKYGVKVKREFFLQFKGVKEKIVWKSTVDQLGLKEDYKKLMEEKGELHLELLKKEMKPIPGALELIKKLKEKYRLGLASSSPIVEINTILSSLKIKKFFEYIVSGEFIEKSKPYPDIYLAAAKKLGVEPKDCIVFEDAVNGVKSAKSAGMKCIAITTSFPKEKLEQADLIVNSFENFNFDALKTL